MSEVKRTFMQELNLWSEANILGPLFGSDPNQDDWTAVEEQVKKAIREKVLESYKNGLKAPRKPAAAVAAVRR